MATPRNRRTRTPPCFQAEYHADRHRSRSGVIANHRPGRPNTAAHALGMAVHHWALPPCCWYGRTRRPRARVRWHPPVAMSGVQSLRPCRAHPSIRTHDGRNDSAYDPCPALSRQATMLRAHAHSPYTCTRNDAQKGGADADPNRLCKVTPDPRLMRRPTAVC